MNLNEITPTLAKKIGAKEFIINGKNDWVRVFVIRPDGCTIGRLSFQNKTLEFQKWYKDKLTGPKVSIDISDEIKYRFYWYLLTKTKLSQFDFNILVNNAKSIAQKRMNDKKEARANLPTHKLDGTKYKRKRLQEISARMCLNSAFDKMNKKKFKRN